MIALQEEEAVCMLLGHDLSFGRLLGQNVQVNVLEDEEIGVDFGKVQSSLSYEKGEFSIDAGSLMKMDKAPFKRSWINE